MTTWLKLELRVIGRYTQEAVNRAVAQIQKGEISFKGASKLYSIPRSTLQDKVKGRSPVVAKSGPSATLTQAEENALVEYIMKMSKIGYGLTKSQLFDEVESIIKEDGRPNPFKDDRPGRDWYMRFLKRHPILSERVSENLGKERAMVSAEKIDTWFQQCEFFLEEVDSSLGILRDDSRIFNADESGFAMCPKTEKVLAQKGSRNVYQLSTSNRKEITVLVCCAANGTYVPPLIVYPGTRFRFDPLQGAPTDFCIGRSKSGWMNTEVFYEWLANHFHPFIQDKGLTKPVILFVDGHKSHVSLPAATFCAENGIILYCLPPHTSHILQPCDLGLFRTLKEHWNHAIIDFQKQNIGENVTKKTFAAVFSNAWKTATKPKASIGGFKASGLFPWDPNAFDREKLAPSEVFAQAQPTPSLALPSTSAQSSTRAQIHRPLIPVSTHLTPSASLPSTSARSLITTTAQIHRPFVPVATQPTPSSVLPAISPQSTTTAHMHRPLVHASEIPTCKEGANRRSKNVLDQTYVSPVIKAHIKYPHISQKNAKNAQTTTSTNTLNTNWFAISGKAYIEAQKEKEETLKKVQEEKQKRKHDREQKKVERELQVAAKKRKKTTPRPVPAQAESDEYSENEEEINENECLECGEQFEEESDPNLWMGCEHCGRWLHKTCSGIDDIILKSDDDIEHLDWQCRKCTEE
ncbi:hypothetical protein BSL78_25928 [Apostichopus japonicus]|uniref:Uncharacterized protein n=1 Tax=Stichopus japonicus TaxID=307972 RepID=A0A2G8JN90_STIJA|nr:hypothetical protein BSL78_25928 [Apostichopus japonicus]